MQMDKLTEVEVQALKKYRLSTGEDSSSTLMIAGIDLLNGKRVKEIMNNELKIKLNTNEQAAIGSLFIKRYAFAAALVLYSMSMFNKGINSSLENLFLHVDKGDSLWLPNFYFGDLSVTVPVNSREEWRKDIVKQLFFENVSKVITSVSKQSKVPKVILWENIAVYIFWMYETLLNDESLSPEKAFIVQDDFHYVVLHAPPQLFGVKARNPLSKYFGPKENDLRVRKTCCLFYLTSKNQDRCNTCPIECKPPAVQRRSTSGSRA